jgi:aryl-alcohol dehydrogenase-like predicted oxidoreductase
MTASTLALRTLGRTSIKIPPLMFGGNVFGWTADERTPSTPPMCIRAGCPAIAAASPKP